MASLAAGAVQTLFAGFAFAGAGTLMHYLEPNAFAEESKRHNRALERLAKAKEKWYEHQVEQKSKIQELRQQLSDASRSINDTNHALDLLARVRTITFHGKTFTKEPRINDYYKPSDKMEKYQRGFTVLVAGLVGGYILTV